MKEVYLLCNMRKQAYRQAMQPIKNEIEKEVVYIRLMEQTREIHPGMGRRTMYAMLEPEGIGRNTFITLGLLEGFRLKVIQKQVHTTYSTKSKYYNNLPGEKKFIVSSPLP